MSRHRIPLPILLVGLAAFAALGLPDGMLGTLWPSMQTSLDRPVSGLGVLSVALTLGYIGSSLTVTWPMRRFGVGATIVTATVIRLAAFAVISSVPSWVAVVIAMFVSGWGGGSTDTAFNTYYAEHADLGSLNFLHGMYGVGATIGPLLAVALLPDWAVGFIILAVVDLLLVAWLFGLVGSWDPISTSGSTSMSAPSTTGWLAIVAFFLYTGVEAATGTWAFSILIDTGTGEARAGIWVALFWGGLTVGRLLLGSVANRLGSRTMLDLSASVLVIGSGLFWLDPRAYGGFGLVISGLGMAAIFPTLVALTPHHGEGTDTDTSMGLQFAAAALGAGGLSYLAGRIADIQGVAVIPSILLGVSGVFAVLWMWGLRPRLAK